MSYENLSEEDKLAQAIRFVAVGQALPKSLEDFLRAASLYDLIVNPGVIEVEHAARN